MSMVVFPFKTEDPDVAVANLRIAATHPRVARVVAVGGDVDGVDRLAAAVVAF